MWRSHASLGEAVIIGNANIICRRQTSFKKVTFVLIDKSDFFVGAGGRGRTDTVLPPRDFESRTSANSITPAIIELPVYYSIFQLVMQDIFDDNSKFFNSATSIVRYYQQFRFSLFWQTANNTRLQAPQRHQTRL